MATWTVEIRSGFSGITLPDGNTYNAGQQAALSDTQWGDLISRGQANVVDVISVTGGSTGALSGLSDVNITSPADNQYLRYDSGAGEWVNETVAAGSQANLDGIITVAAANTPNAAPSPLKDNADYVGTGTGGSRTDGTTIQNAINALPSSGGEIVLLPGTYYVEATSATPPIRLNTYANVSIRFMPGAVIDYQPNSNDTPAIRVEKDHCHVFYPNVTGPSNKNGYGSAVEVGNIAGAQPSHCSVVNPFLQKLKAGVKFSLEASAGANSTTDCVLHGGRFSQISTAIISEGINHYISGNPQILNCSLGIQQTSTRSKGRVVIESATVRDWSDAAISLDGGRGSEIISAFLEHATLESANSTEAIRLGTASSTIVNPKIGFVHFSARGVSGTATSGGASTLTDSGRAWVVNEWAGATVTITGGTGSGQTATVASNTATVLTISGTWTTNPDSTSTYQIGGTVREDYALRLYRCRGLVGDHIEITDSLVDTAIVRVENYSQTANNLIRRLSVADTVPAGWGTTNNVSYAVSDATVLSVESFSGLPGDAAGTTYGSTQQSDPQCAASIFKVASDTYLLKRSNNSVVLVARDTGQWPSSPLLALATPSGGRSVSGFSIALAFGLAVGNSIKLAPGKFDLGWATAQDLATTSDVTIIGSGVEQTYITNYTVGTQDKEIFSFSGAASRFTLRDLTVCAGGDLNYAASGLGTAPSGATSDAIALTSHVDARIEGVRFLVARDRAILVDGSGGGHADLSSASANTIERCLFDGALLEPPGSAPTLASIAGSLSAATYRYVMTWVNDVYQESAPSGNVAITLGSPGAIRATLPSVSPSAGTVVARKLYRYVSAAGQYMLVATVFNNTNSVTVDDTLTDANLTTAPSATQSGNTPLPPSNIGGSAVEFFGAARNTLKTSTIRACVRGVTFSKGGSPTILPTGNKVKTNTIERCVDWGIHGTTGTDNVLDDNIVRNNNQRRAATTGGIYLVDDATSVCQRWGITENQCNDDQAFTLPAVTTLTSDSGNNGLVTFASAHKLVTGQSITIAGASNGAYNSTWNVVVTGANTVRFYLGSNPGVATGSTITVAKTQTHGIFVDAASGGAGNSSHMIERNNCRGNTTLAILNESASTIIQQNWAGTSTNAISNTGTGCTVRENFGATSVQDMPVDTTGVIDGSILKWNASGSKFVVGNVPSYRRVTTDTILTTTDEIVVFDSASNRLCTLPAVASAVRVVWVKTANTGTVTISGDVNIDGAATYVLGTQDEAAMFVPDAANSRWRVF